MIDQRCEFRLGLLLHGSGVLDLLKHPGGSYWRLPLRKTMWLCR